MRRKAIYLFICVGLMFNGIAMAQSLVLPEETPAEVRESAREMVNRGIDANAVAVMTTKMVNHGFDEAQMVRAQNMVMATSQEGMPTEPLMTKANEGIAKQVGPERILNAMETVQRRYRTAANHAKDLDAETGQCSRTCEAIAQGMAAGLDADSVGEIKAQLQRRQKAANRTAFSDLTVASYQTARDMTRMGTKPDTAADLVCLAVSSGYDADRMNRLRQEFRERRTREETDELGEQYRNQFRHGQDPLPDLLEEGSENKYRHRNGSGNDDGGPTGSGSAGNGNQGGASGSGNGSGGSGGSDGSGGSSGSGGSGGTSGSGGSSGTGGSDGSGGSSGSGGSGGSGGTSGSGGSSGTGGSDGSGDSGGSEGTGKSSSSGKSRS